MAQYLTIRARHKDAPTEQTLDLYSWCTTPAREMSSEGIFPYTQEDRLIDAAFLKAQADALEDLAKDEDAGVAKYTQELADLQACQGVKGVDSWLSAVKEARIMIESCKEDAERWRHYKSIVEHIMDMAHDTQNSDWQFYYYNC